LEIKIELNFLSSSSNCRVLERLAISYNPLDITLPDSIGNFSTTLHSITLLGSKIVKTQEKALATSALSPQKD
jgi:hypothetical protein